MIPYRTIKSEFYDFDEEHYRAVGRRHHKVIQLGDPLRIRVKGTNLEQKLLDYELVEPEHENEPAPSEDEYIETLTDAPMPPRARRKKRRASR
jgi:DNA-directed RNA polymerase subunit E'/Rpb7